MKKELEKILFQVSLNEAMDDGNLEHVEELILTSLIQGLSIPRASFWLYIEPSKSVSCKLLIDKYHHSKIENYVVNRHNSPIYFKHFDTKRIIKADDALTESALIELTNDYIIPNEITSKLDISIHFHGEIVGFICCEYIKQAHHWSDEEIIFVTTLANLYSLSMIINEKNQYKAKLELLNNELELQVLARTSELEKKLLELEQTQEALIESKKMAALGDLVAGVAHEINTPLGVAITASSWLEDQLVEIDQAMVNEALSQSTLTAFVSKAKTSVEMSLNNLRRAAQLVSDFKQTAVSQSGYEKAN